MSKPSRIDLTSELGRLNEMVSSLYVEVMMIERLLCEVAEKLRIDSDTYHDVCSTFGGRE